MTMISVDEARELAPGYVMGTLTPDEITAFDLAMQLPAIAAVIGPELEAHRSALEFLATERSVQPPPSLRARVLERIADEQRRAAHDPSVTPARPLTVSSAERSLSETVPPESRHAPSAAPTPIRVSGEQRTPGSVGRATPPATLRVIAPTRNRAPWWIAGVFGGALAAAGVFAVNLNTRLLSTQQELAAAQRVAAGSAAQLAEREATLRSLLDGGNDLVLVRLIANESAEPGMQVFWNKRKGSAVVLAVGLKPVAADRAYCLWLIKDNVPVAVKLFNVDADGRAVVSGVSVPTTDAGITAFAVTEEPVGGSPQPTMTPFLVGALPKL